MLQDAYVETQLMAVGAGDVGVKRIVQTSKALIQSGRADDGINLLGTLNVTHAERDFHAEMQRMIGDDLLQPYMIDLTIKTPAGNASQPSQ